ncbi:MAG: hypothetical protein M9899_03395 [Bdellovibrionaceae bacterium]|nr:hypothetical protein [Pseudobdellovibrionaceae bacterium]
MKKLIGYSTFLLFLAACQNDMHTQQLSSIAANQMSCEQFESQMFDILHLSLEENQKLPEVSAVMKQLQKDFTTLDNYEEHKEDIQKIIVKFEEFYTALVVEFPKKLGAENIEEIKKLLSHIETRDQMTKTTKSIQDTFRSHLNELQVLSKNLQQNCSNDTPNDQDDSTPDEEPIAGSLFEQLQNKYPPEIFGTYKTFATAYQNCEALNVPTIQNSKSSLEGIKVTGRHSSGGGNVRVISSLSSVQRTHPYLSQRTPDSSCFSTYNSPLIYDYGGKPYSAAAANAELNFFKNHGTGSAALGTDCSGFIFTALATAGLKLNPSVNLKARDVLSYNSARFKNPSSGGTTCFRKIAVAKTEDLAVGDVVASSGHIFIVTKTGQDPLGIRKAKSLSECSKITSANFDFELAQSSPTNNAIGINMMTASYYLPTSPTMKTGMEKYAKFLCESRFKSISEPNVSEVSVVRHKKTSECMSTFKVALTGEKCVESCRAQ